jgi:hypothetical protein
MCTIVQVTSRLALGCTQPHFQYVPAVKWPECEADRPLINLVPTLKINYAIPQLHPFMPPLHAQGLCHHF